MQRHIDLVLPNGLAVVLVPLPTVHSVVASLYLRVGSRFESRQTNGISHFLEHMLFRGTKTLPSAHAQALAFERIGGTLYAATHVDHGVMSVSVPPQNLTAMIELLADVMTEPRLSDIETERRIVREEILEDLDDRGRDVDADNITRAVMYDSHPLGFTITGSLESLDRFDETMLRSHHAAHYTAANSVLCIAGNMGDPDSCVHLLERCFGAISTGSLVQAISPPNGQSKPLFRFVQNQSSQTDLRVAFRTVSERDPREPAVEMLLRMLDDGMSTRLYEHLCDRLGLCYDVSALSETYEDDGVLDIAAGVQHDRATVVVQQIFSLLHQLVASGPREDELEKARNRHSWSIDAMYDDPEETAGFYGIAALTRLIRSPQERHEQLARVTATQVRDVARDLFRPERLTVVAVGLLRPSEQTKLEKLVRAFG